MGWPVNWNDASLRVHTDSPVRARYRLLQSWYRANVLRVPPGLSSASRGEARLVGSMLAAESVAARPSLNFLTPEIASYAERRMDEVRAANGTIDEERLRRNMLSPVPLCFNLFGYLRLHAADAAVVLRNALALDIATIERIDVEEAPLPAEHLGDGTAFDAIVEYRTSRGEAAFLGVETKYTEPFSATEYEAERYTELTEDAQNGFLPGAAKRLKYFETNQLWRTVLLVLSLRAKKQYAFGHAVVVACRGDTAAERALLGLRAELAAPETVLRSVALESLMEGFSHRTAVEDWARAFTQRYLDLGPVR